MSRRLRRNHSIGIQVVLLIEYGIVAHKRTLEVLTVDPDTFADLEGDA